MNTHEITPTEKRRLDEAQEQTRQGRYYVPYVDIHESETAIRIRADMPGVAQNDVTVELNDDVLSIVGHISPERYQNLRPVHTEYNVGNFARRFTLVDVGRFERDRISAKISDGVLEVTIPKSERARPRRIEVR